MEINNTVIEAGENKTFRLDVSKLPSGTVISVQAHVFRSTQEGPTLLVSAGVHGDEINGVEIVRRAVENGVFDQLKCGTVIAIPLVNIHGFNNFSRDLPDGKDVNRSFPGKKSGSLASRVAHVITSEIFPLIDYGIDFHTGGSSIYNYPQIRAYKEDEESLELAKVFNAPLLVETGLISKSMRKEAYNHGIPMIVFEGGESLRLDEFSINQGIRGIKRLMYHFGMSDTPIEAQEYTTLQTHKWIRSSSAGIFIPKKVSGEHFKNGEILGLITDPYTQFEKKIIAKQDGFIFGHDNQPVINQGRALFHIGW